MSSQNFKVINLKTGVFYLLYIENIQISSRTL